MGSPETGEQNQQIDPVIFAARRKTEALGIDPGFGEAVASAKSVEEINDHSIRLDLQGDAPQILGIVYRRLAASDPNFASAVERQIALAVSELGVPDDLPGWFLENDTGLPGFLISQRRGNEVDKAKRIAFVAAALKVMFRLEQEYLRA